MSKRMCLKVSLVLVCTMVGNSFAAMTYNQYKGINGATDWATNVANWAGNVLPQAGDTPGVAGASEWKIGFKTANSPALTSGVLAGDVLVVGGAIGNLTVNGTTINVSQYITLAAGAADVGGVMTMNMGTVNTGVMLPNSAFYVSQLGVGVLNMTGGVIRVGKNYAGTLTIAQSATSTGTVNLSGGTIYATDLAMGLGNAKINLNADGKIILTGDKTSTVSPWLNSLISTTDAGKTVGAKFENGSTIISVIPEPATMALLGLGIFGLIRRK